MISTLRAPAFPLEETAENDKKPRLYWLIRSRRAAEIFFHPAPAPDGRGEAARHSSAYVPQTSRAKARKFSPMIFSMRASEWPRALRSEISLRNWSGPLRSTTKG